MALTLSQQQFKTIFPNASRSCIAANVETGSVRVCDPERKREPKKTLDSGPQGKEEGDLSPDRRTTVKITRFGLRLLDEDNLWAGTKPLVDALKEAGLIEDDSPLKIRRVVEQRLVHSHDEIRTELELIYG